MSETARKELQLAFCPGCGTFLQKASVAQSEQICPCCGRDVVVSIKNGKVIVFESRREAKILGFCSAVKEGVSAGKKSSGGRRADRKKKNIEQIRKAVKSKGRNVTTNS